MRHGELQAELQRATALSPHHALPPREEKQASPSEIKTKVLSECLATLHLDGSVDMCVHGTMEDGSDSGSQHAEAKAGARGPGLQPRRHSRAALPRQSPAPRSRLVLPRYLIAACFYERLI